MTGIFKNGHSIYDPGQVVKEVHDFYGQRIRVLDGLTVVPSYYTHFRADYNANNDPTCVTYFRGTSPHKTTITVLGDVGGNLQNKYFTIRDNPSDEKYHLWFNVDSLGVDPAPANSTGIEIPIMSNDPDAVVAIAIDLVVNSLFNKFFEVTRASNTLEIESKGRGIVTASVDFNTSFSLSNTLGTQEEIAKICIDYDGIDPIYEGQVLKGYSFDIYSGKFIKNPEVTVTTDVISDPDIQNIMITLANTEYPIVFPEGTQQFMLRVRSSAGKLQFSWVAGNTATEFFTVERGNTYTENNIKLTGSNKTIYVRSTVAGVIVEVLSWS